MRFKHGSIIESNISTTPDEAEATEQAHRVHKALNGLKLHELHLTRLHECLDQLGPGVDATIIRELSKFLGDILSCN